MDLTTKEDKGFSEFPAPPRCIVSLFQLNGLPPKYSLSFYPVFYVLMDGLMITWPPISKIVKRTIYLISYSHLRALRALQRSLRRNPAYGATPSDPLDQSHTPALTLKAPGASLLGTIRLLKKDIGDRTHHMIQYLQSSFALVCKSTSVLKRNETQLCNTIKFISSPSASHIYRLMCFNFNTD